MAKRFVWSLLIVVALSASACGARLTAEQRATVAAGSNGAAAGTAGGDAAAAGDTAAGGDTAGDPAAGDAAGGGDVAAGGDDAAAGGDAAAAAGGGGAAASSCAGDATDVGVTPTELRIGNVSTISGPVPGFGQTGVNAVKAYANFRNASGGLCGRKLVVITADDRLDAGVNRDETAKLLKQVFAFVGGTSVVDDGGASVLSGTNVSDTSLSTAEARIKLPNNFSPTPIDLASGGNGAVNIAKYFKNELGVKSAALVWAAQSTSRTRAKAYKNDLTDAGIPVKKEFEVPVAETNYSSVANEIANAKIDLVLTTLEISGMSRLAKALDQANYQPKAPFYGAQAYGKKFLDQSGASANGTVLGLNFSIFEDRAQVKAVDDFLTWYTRTNPGADIDFFAVEAWVSADMFATALEQTKKPPSRDALLAQLKTFTSFDAHGFKAPINPAQKKPATCYMITSVKNGKWVRTHPAKGFAC